MASLQGCSPSQPAPEQSPKTPGETALEIQASLVFLLTQITGDSFHPGASGHLKAAQVQLAAVCHLLTSP